MRMSKWGKSELYSSTRLRVMSVGGAHESEM